MNNSINLLDYKNKVAVTPSSSKQRLLRKIAVGLLFTSATFSIMFFMLISFSPLPQLEETRKRASDTLSSHDKDIAKLILVKERTDNIKQILDTRTKYDEILGSLQSKLPPGTAVKSVQLKEKNISVVVSSKSLLTLDTFLKQIIDSKTKEYTNIRMSELSTDLSDNNFYLTLNIEML